MLYYATLGATICQQLNACNDFAYFNLVRYGSGILAPSSPRAVISCRHESDSSCGTSSLMCAAKVAGEEEESVLVAKAKQQPPYRRTWKPFKQAMRCVGRLRIQSERVWITQVFTDLFAVCRPLRPTTATVHGELIQIDRLMYHSVSCLQKRTQSPPSRPQSMHAGLVRGPSSCSAPVQHRWLMVSV